MSRVRETFAGDVRMRRPPCCSQANRSDEVAQSNWKSPVPAAAGEAAESGTASLSKPETIKRSPTQLLSAAGKSATPKLTGRSNRAHTVPLQMVLRSRRQVCCRSDVAEWQSERGDTRGVESARM